MASLALPDGATPHPPMLFRGQHLGQHDTEAEMPAGHEVNNPPRPWPGGTIQSPELEYRIPEEPIHQPASLSRRIIHKARLFFSAEGGDLRHTTWIFFRLAITLVQVVIIATILALSGWKLRSKSDPRVSEYEDCKKLGIWDALWAVRAILGSGMIIWEWKQYLEKRRRGKRLGTADRVLTTMRLVDKADLNLERGTEARGPQGSESTGNTSGLTPNPNRFSSLPRQVRPFTRIPENRPPTPSAEDQKSAPPPEEPPLTPSTEGRQSTPPLRDPRPSTPPIENQPLTIPPKDWQSTPPPDDLPSILSLEDWQSTSLREERPCTPPPEDWQFTPPPDDMSPTPSIEDWRSTPLPEERSCTPPPADQRPTPSPENWQSIPPPDDLPSTPSPENRQPTPIPEERPRTPPLADQRPTPPIENWRTIPQHDDLPSTPSPKNVQPTPIPEERPLDPPLADQRPTLPPEKWQSIPPHDDLPSTPSPENRQPTPIPGERRRTPPPRDQRLPRPPKTGTSPAPEDQPLTPPAQDWRFTPPLDDPLPTPFPERARSIPLPENRQPTPPPENRQPTPPPENRQPTPSPPAENRQPTPPSEERQRIPARHEPLQHGRAPVSPSEKFFDRLDTFLTATGLIHFVVNHIWLYTTVHTCRVNDPHVWYLGLGIASLGYAIVMELLLIAFIVFVLGPILLWILNLIMLCLGRPVDRHGSVIVQPEIPAMNQALIDKVPLVVYVPPPEPEVKTSEEPVFTSESHTANRKAEENSVSGAGVTTTAAEHPSITSTVTTLRPPRRRFAWTDRRGGKGTASKLTMWSDAQLLSEGDARFENSEYPFVVLESNRATCSICLAEFVEPKRKEAVPPLPSEPKTSGQVAAMVKEDSLTSPIEEGDEIKGHPAIRHAASSEGRDPIQNGSVQATLEDEDDGGIPGEPLRLLACGHVFHIRCIDHWLSRTSARCPLCKRKVDVPKRK